MYLLPSLYVAHPTIQCIDQTFFDAFGQAEFLCDLQAPLSQYTTLSSHQYY